MSTLPVCHSPSRVSFCWPNRIRNFGISHFFTRWKCALNSWIRGRESFYANKSHPPESLSKLGIKFSWICMFKYSASARGEELPMVRGSGLRDDLQKAAAYAPHTGQQLPNSSGLCDGIVHLGDTALHWENYISISFQIEQDMNMLIVFLSILNQMEFHSVQNRMENCHHDHISFKLKGNGNIVLSA